MCRPGEGADRNPELAAKYPLKIISPKSHELQNSRDANESRKREREGEQFVLVSECDAANRGISDGDRVRVFNGRGAFARRARVSDDVNPGLPVTTVGYWRQLSSDTVNAISSAEFVNMGRAATGSDNLVELERVE